MLITFIGSHDITICLHVPNAVRGLDPLATTGLTSRLQGVEQVPGVQRFEPRRDHMELFDLLELRLFRVLELGDCARRKVHCVGLGQQRVQASLQEQNKSG